MRETGPGMIAAAALALSAPAVAGACYVPDVAASSLVFTAVQKGEPFEGRFRGFTGTLCLDPAAPTSGSIELTVHTGSVETGLPEADQALRSALFLDAEAHPAAVFRSTAIRSLGADRFEVTGTFSLRDGERELTVPFVFRPVENGDAWLLEGETSIRRLDYGVGIGQWLDTEFLDDLVRLSFSVRLRAP